MFRLTICIRLEMKLASIAVVATVLFGCGDKNTEVVVIDSGVRRTTEKELTRSRSGPGKSVSPETQEGLGEHSSDEAGAIAGVFRSASDVADAAARLERISGDLSIGSRPHIISLVGGENPTVSHRGTRRWDFGPISTAARRLCGERRSGVGSSGAPWSSC